jgi:hypothetical protein
MVGRSYAPFRLHIADGKIAACECLVLSGTGVRGAMSGQVPELVWSRCGGLRSSPAKAGVGSGRWRTRWHSSPRWSPPTTSASWRAVTACGRQNCQVVHGGEALWTHLDKRWCGIIRVGSAWCLRMAADAPLNVFAFEEGTCIVIGLVVSAARERFVLARTPQDEVAEETRQ